MNTQILILLDNINQLIPALAALAHYRKHDVQKKSLTFVIKPHINMPAQALEHLHALLKNHQPYALIIGAQLCKHAFLLYVPVRLRAIYLRRRFARLTQQPVSELFFAHDNSSDFWNQTFMQAFKSAGRICYGDAFGIVYGASYFNQLMYRLTHNDSILYKNIIARMKRYFLYPSKKKYLAAQKALLAIPCDPGRDVLPACELSVVSREQVQQTVAQLTHTLLDFTNHFHELTKPHLKLRALLMLSNFTESKLTTLDNEIKLYQHILKTHISKDHVVVLKPHPACNDLIFQQIKEQLSLDYEVLTIDKKFYHLPIELAESFVQQCDVLSVSFTSISLPYLFGKQVTHVLTQDLIHQYFLPHKVFWFLESNQLYLDMMDALTTWTGDHALQL